MNIHYFTENDTIKKDSEYKYLPEKGTTKQ